MSKKKTSPPKRRNVVVINMINRRQKAGHHGDKKKEASRKACRGPRKRPSFFISHFCPIIALCQNLKNKGFCDINMVEEGNSLLYQGMRVSRLG